MPYDRRLDEQRPAARTTSARTTTTGTSSRSSRCKGGSVTRPIAEVLLEVAEQLGQLAG